MPTKPLTFQEIIHLSNDSRKKGEQHVATMTLATLRHIRDTFPAEWDALTQSPAGPIVCSLWDFLKAAEKGDSPLPINLA